MAWRAPDGLDEALATALGRFVGGPVGPSDVARGVRALSDFYNGLGPPPADPDARLSAEVLFFLPADLGKVPFALSELAALGREPQGGTLRLLDLGAGTGTASLGARLALRCERLMVVAIDRDARSLEVGRAVHEEIGRRIEGIPPVTYETIPRDLSARWIPDGTFDLVVAQGLLSELPAASREPLVRAALGALAPHGVVLLIEPALRKTARELHALRDSLLASSAARVFAPCIRQGPCPCLDRESDWCHEDREWEPSTFVATVARLAGLRRSGLKLAYVTLVGDASSVASATGGDDPAYRVVSDVLRSKGKREAFLCGEVGRLKVSLLRRDESEANDAFREARRGDVVRVSGTLDESRARIGAETRVRR